MNWHKVKEFIADKAQDLEWAIEDLECSIRERGFFAAHISLLEKIFNRTIRRVYRKIRKIVQWIPLLWEDEDWDYNYILTVLDYKLSRTYNEIKNGYGDDEEWIKPRCAEIQEVRDMIVEIKADAFAEKEYSEHEEKYGLIKMIYDEEVVRNSRTVIIAYEKAILPDGSINETLNDEAKNARLEISKIEENRRNEAMNKMFSLVAKNIRGWWD
jgi:hypothetical protein